MSIEYWENLWFWEVDIGWIHLGDIPGGYKDTTVTINEEVVGSHSVTAFPLLLQ